MLWTKTKSRASAAAVAPRFPGVWQALDGSAAVVAMETAASEGAGAYPITPSTQMGEGWAAAVADGARNVNGRPLLFFEPEGEHAAAAVTAGMSMTGLRATNFSSGQGIAYMHESLYAAVGKRLTYVLNVACRAITKHALNVHAGHDDYHAVDDTGFFQLFAKNVQEAADLNLVAHRLAELSLNPGICAQDGFLTSHVIESVRLPERELVRELLGDPADIIDSPTPAQRLVFGPKRRRIPEMFDLDNPAMLGVVQNQDSYAQGVAAQRPFYFDHVAALADRAFEEFAALTGRRYARVSGYRMDDSEWVILGQGSVVSNAEAVADHLRDSRGLKVGVVNLTMFRPFPSDLLARLLAGRKGVVVLERTDQPLAADPPLLREIRAAMAQASENGRCATGTSRRNGNAATELPHPSLPSIQPHEIPDFYSGCFGLGSRDLQPGDIIAAVENMLPGAAQRRQFYLGIDFLRPDTRLPKLQIWQQQIREAYPRIAESALSSTGDVNLLPKDAVAVRIHSVGGWGAITMGKNLSSTVFDLFEMHVKANPKYGSEKKGQPTTFYATYAREPIRLNCELRHVDVVLSPDPNVFRHSNPLAGLQEGGVFVMQTDRDVDAFWRGLPAWARREIRRKKIRLHVLDGFAIAGAEAGDVELRYRMQGAAFMGAFFSVSPLIEREGADRATVFAGIGDQLKKKFARYGQRVVDDNMRVITRGFDEVRAVDYSALQDEVADVGSPLPEIPDLLNVGNAQHGFANAGQFWERVCFLQKTGSDGLADPFAALSAIPAVTGVMRDMTDVRLEVPKFIPVNCTGCSQCWTQCPDSAIPGLVVEIDQLIEIGMAETSGGKPMDRMRQIVRHLAQECRKIAKAAPLTSFGAVLSAAYKNVTGKLTWEPEKLRALEEEFTRVHARLADFPCARTAPFFDGPEAKSAGSGGLLAITVNPEACKGCNLCVDVCPDGALISVKQEPEVVASLRDDWSLWQKLPDTPDRFINVASVDEGIGTLSSLLLKKAVYRSMVGGDGACMGCGEKTSVHLVVAAVHALMAPRVTRHVDMLDALVAKLDAEARRVLAHDADLAAAAATPGELRIQMDAAKQARLDLLTRTKRSLEDLRWRYKEGPSGKGRAALGMANSTGCSSVWGSTYPYNPYPFPWTNHLFQDSPSLAIGLFEGHMRKMADGFRQIRRAELLLSGEYDAAQHEPELELLHWSHFTDEEFGLCPPILAMGGDGAMLDIGFQNLSRLLASGKPIRVIVLDTQVYSNTGGQACTSGFTGQVSDMAAYGRAQHGKSEERKELALIALAHRGAFVHQTSQASASHLLGGVLKALQKRRPALVNIYAPCPVEHGLADDWAAHAARLALESRAFPFLTYDPDSGASLADCLSLDGNPAIDAPWPTYTLEFTNEDGKPEKRELPLTIADWAATEGRFKKHFAKVQTEKWNEDMVPFAEYLELAADEREGQTPFIYVVDDVGRLGRLSVSTEIVRLAEERQRFWSLLRQMAGLEIAPSTRDTIAGELGAEYEEKLTALRAEYEGKIASLQASYPAQIARRMASALLREAKDKRTIADLIATMPLDATVPVPGNDLLGVIPSPSPVIPSPSPVIPSPSPVIPSEARDLHLFGAGSARDLHRFGAGSARDTQVSPTLSSVSLAPSAVQAVPPAAAVAVAEPEELTMEAYVESARCTSCNECTNLNGRLFAYNADKQAYVKDAKAGTFQQLVLAAERCPVSIIHPGTPLNPKEKDLAKWVERAKRFT